MYNINTKAKRTELLNHIKESRLNKGYKLETFEGLQIFTKFDEVVNKHYLEVYCDNSTKPLLNYYYINEAQMLTRIQTTKDNYLSRKNWKEEQKAKNKGVKITLATFKAFLNKNSDNIFVKELSRFDGMVDCVMNVKDDFSQVKRSENISEHDLGFSGCWLVGSSRDSISVYEDDIYTGFQVYNSCGSWIAATPKQVKQEIKPTQPEVKQGSVNIIEYGKGLAVIGETYAIKDKLKAIGGRFNKFLTCGAGWVFTSDKLEEIKTMLLSLKESKEVQQAEEVQEVSTEETKTTLNEEINKTLDFFAQTDLKMIGQITEGTKECFNIQKPEVEEFKTLEGITEAAKGGKVISILNLFDLVQADQRKAIN